MGSMMTLVDAFAVVMFMILIYLLSKIIIEKERPVYPPWQKFTGTQTVKLARLYIVSTSMVVVTFLLINLPIEYWIMVFMFRAIMMRQHQRMDSILC